MDYTTDELASQTPSRVAASPVPEPAAPFRVMPRRRWVLVPLPPGHCVGDPLPAITPASFRGTANECIARLMQDTLDTTPTLRRA
jgi:hypothetical protein